MNDRIVNDIHNYIEEIYEPLEYLTDKKNVLLVRNRIDKGLYVVKYVKTNECQIYDTLKGAAIPGIPRIYEIVSSPDEVLIVEEYIKGITLEAFTDRNVVLERGMDDNIGLVLNLVKKLCEILNRIHTLQPAIIHRDIKPDNILIDDDGNVFLLDFNISRYYKGGYEKDTVNMGTNGFAAPEQFGFGESSNRTDIYGLGATVKYICEKCDIKSECVDTFVKKCMELSPDDRFPDAPAACRFLESQVSGDDMEEFLLPLLLSEEKNHDKGFVIQDVEEASYMERRVNPTQVLPLKIICGNCKAEMELHSYMTHFKCRTCGNDMPFNGFDYRRIDWNSSMYSEVNLWTDCMVCRSPNMYLGPEGKVWKCPECGFRMTAMEKEESVFWFCDGCETFMNIQKGFNVDTGHWICQECGYENDVSQDNII